MNQILSALPLPVTANLRETENNPKQVFMLSSLFLLLQSKLRTEQQLIHHISDNLYQLRNEQSEGYRLLELMRRKSDFSTYCLSVISAHFSRLILP